jgi:hypothetical protein
VPIPERMRYLVSQKDCHQISKAMERKPTMKALKIIAYLSAITLGSCNTVSDFTSSAPSPLKSTPSATATKAEPQPLSLPFGHRKSNISTLAQEHRDGQTVYVQGTVQQQAPLLEGTLYQLQDTTGSIWISTQQSPPAPGEAIAIKGTLRYKSILINGIDIGEYYLEELERGAMP